MLASQPVPRQNTHLRKGPLAAEWPCGIVTNVSLGVQALSPRQSHIGISHHTVHGGLEHSPDSGFGKIGFVTVIQQDPCQDLALRFQCQVIHTLGLFLQERQRSPVGNTPKLCLNPLQKSLPQPVPLKRLLQELSFLSGTPSQAYLPRAHLPGSGGGGAATAAAAVNNNQ